MTQGNVNLKLGLDTTPATVALQQYYKKLNQGAQQAAGSQRPVGIELARLVKAARKVGLEYNSTTKIFKDGSTGAALSIKEVNARIKELNGGLTKTKGVAQNALNGIAQGFKQVLQGIPQGIGLAIGQQLLAPLNNFGSIISGSIGGAVGRFVDIDAALRQTASISGATEAEFRELQDAVIGLAKDTKFTTGELAEASIGLARAGFSAQEVQEALPGIAEGAAAAGQGMEQMSDTVIGAMGGFQKSTSETTAVVDILTATANGSNQSVTDLGEALKYVGPIANGLGLSLEDTSAALGLLANAGIRGSQAGTTLRAGLSRLSAAAAGQNSEFSKLSRGTGRLSKTLQMLGADVTNAEGDLKSFPELLKTLKKSLGSLSANEQQLVSKILFGEEAAAGFRALLSNSVADIEAFAASTNNATGTAADTSKKNLSGIAGSLTLLASAFDAASATVGKFLEGFLKPLIDALTGILNAFNSLPGPLQNLVIALTAVGGAAAIAAAGFVLFKAAAAGGLFAGIGAAAAGVGAQMAALGTTMSGMLVGAIKGAGAALVGLKAALAKTITIKEIATIAQNKYSAALLAMKGLSMKAVLASIASGLTAAGAAAGKAAVATAKFLLANASLIGLGIAIGAVAAAWNTYNNVKKQANAVTESAEPIHKSLAEALKEQEITAKGANSELKKLDKEWETTVERVGFFDASLEGLRKGLMMTTAEEAQLQHGTVALLKEFGAITEGTDQLVAKYKEIAESLKDASPEERAKKMAQLKAIEEDVKGIVSASVQELTKQRDAFIDASGGVDDMTDAEKQQLQVFDQLIKGFGLSSDMLGILKDKFVEGKEAAEGFNKALSDMSLPELEAEVKKASAAFKAQVKAMGEAFNNFKKQLAEGLKAEVGAIKDDISSLKDASKVFQAGKDDEIRAIKEIGDAASRSAEDQKAAIKKSTDARVSSLERVAAKQKSNSDQLIRNMETAKQAVASRYNKEIDAANAAHSRVMRNLDEQLRAIDKQKEAVESRYDAALDALRELTPAEKQLAALDKFKLQQQAKLGGEEGLRAQAALERMAADEQAAILQVQKEQELAILEKEREAKEEEIRSKELAHDEEMTRRAKAQADLQEKLQSEIDQVKADAAAKEKAAEADIAQAKADGKAAEAQLAEDMQQIKRDNEDEIKRLEQQKRDDKAATAAAEKVMLEEIKKLENAVAAEKTKAEEAYNARKNDLLEQFNEAVGNTTDVIIREGETAWGTYADNAITELRRVEAAAKAAAAAAAANGGKPKGVWTGGPVSAGQTYTVNELGQEAFRSSTGKLSLIDAPAFGRWKAPSKGTVINAAQTEKLGLPSAGSPVAVGATIDPTGGAAAQGASGSETRNLLRAIAAATGGDKITNNVTIQAANTTRAASDMMVELTKIKRRRLR